MAFAARLAAVGAAVEASLELGPGRGTALVMRSFALTRGLWQQFAAFEHASGLDAEPSLRLIVPDFGTELAAALTEYWRGALDE